MYTGNCIESSNLSFTATFCKHKPLIFLEKVGGLWFLVSEKRPHGTDMGLDGVYGVYLIDLAAPQCVDLGYVRA